MRLARWNQLARYGITSPIDRALATAWLREMSHYPEDSLKAGLEWYRDVGRHCKSPDEFTTKAYAAAEATPGLFDDMAQVGTDLAVKGPTELAEAIENNTLLPEYRAAMSDDMDVGDESATTNTEEGSMAQDEFALKAQMGTPEYFKAGRDGQTPQQKLALIYQRREAAGTLPPVGRDAEPATVCIEHKPTFTLPPGREAAPGFKTTLPAGSSKEMTR